jgi:rhamnogalacturonyl hydrolase YesR
MDISLHLEKLKCYVEEKNFEGYDPYDALNSPILTMFSFNKRYPRIAYTQILKRLPINMRPLFRIREDSNPKGIGLFLWSYAKLFCLEEKTIYLEKIQYLMDLLEKLKSKGYSGNCWGYNFDWQSKKSLVRKYTPTIVNSSFIGHALIDTYRLTGNERALAMAKSIKDFILNDMNRKEENGAICFSYTPMDHGTVHNANLLGASLLIRLYKYTGDTAARDIALRSLTYSMKYQRDDGSWYYGETERQKWIDSFHTGFNLQSLLYFLEEGFANEYQEAFKKGVEFYSKNFFLHDGTPKYYHDRIFPIDVHSPAEAVVFFSKMGNTYLDLTKKILLWMIENLQDSKGFFYFQKKRFYVNKIPYMRWSQAWAFHALTEFMIRIKGEV